MKIDPKQLKEGEILSETRYYYVKGSTSRNLIGSAHNLIDDNKIEFKMSDELIANTNSASQFTEVKQLSRTEIVEIMEGAGSRVFTVNYNLAIKPEDFIDIIRKDDGKIRSNKDLEKDFKKVKGTKRTLVGHLASFKAKFGRFQVIDLELHFKGEKNCFRQVDQQTINWLILDGIKYEV